jgi:O-succinylbenzoic acid--CoA ligase
VTTRAVELLPVPSGAAAAQVLPALAAALRGEGPVWQPVAEDAVTSADRAAGHLEPAEDDPADPTALLVSTSGSTGEPKAALLPVSALVASSAATEERLGGAGTWLLALPAHHIAGLQVLLRSVAAGTAPMVMNLRDGFSPNGFAAATADLRSRPGANRTYTSLVPTQLTRLLDAGGEPLAALTSYDAVLVGGAATAPSAVRRARAEGVTVVTTYGMSETCGGCVYDGRPLTGVRWRTSGDGRVELGGAVVARGYRGRPGHPAFTVDDDGTRWFATDDIGTGGEDGHLRVLGRLDDVIVTGGLKVSPALVESALSEHPGIRDVVVVGVPDREWGERVVAVVVPDAGGAGGASPPDLAALHRRVADLVAPYAAPRGLVLVEQIPLIGPGKPDRAALRTLAARAPSVTGKGDPMVTGVRRLPP